MAQPNVAREPSMEEILASIRRIIESNEPPAPAKIVPARAAPLQSLEDEEDDEIRLTVDDDMQVAEFDAGEVGSAPVAPAGVDDRDRALSLADVAARVRSASERNASQLRQADAGEARRTATAESPVVTSRMAELRATTPTAAAAMRVANDPGIAVPEPGSLAEQLSLDEEIAALDLMPTASTDIPAADAQAIAVDQSPARVEQRSAATLLSPEAGDHVARSFGALAAAVDVKLSRSVDEIATEMLRPMLQEWLDDNLPTLVERLVREEIERVARGPRR